MSIKIAHEVEDAQVALYAEVTAALVKFTEATGLVVSDMSWRVERTFDKDGHTCAVCYWGARGSLCSGMN